MAIAGAIDAFCRRELGVGVARGLFHQSSVGAVTGVVLEDGRCLVIKAHQPERSGRTRPASRERPGRKHERALRREDRSDDGLLLSALFGVSLRGKLVAMSDPPRRWTEDAALEAIVARWDGGPSIFAPGWRNAGWTRVGFLVTTGRRATMDWNGYVADDAVDRLRDRLGERGPVERGGVDLMFATRWKVAWTESPGACRIFAAGRLRCEAEGAAISIVPRLGRARRLPASAVRAVRAEGHAFRARSRIELELERGRAIAVASSWDLAAALSDDPWAIREAWTVKAGAHLAAVLGVPLRRVGDV